MKSLAQLVMLTWLSGWAILPAHAAFSSLYVFGDTVSCTTTTSNAPSNYYYGNRYSNGRVWVEVLAQRLGLTYSSSKNLSYFGHYSAYVITEAKQFYAADANTALFVVWVNDADFAWAMDNLNTGDYNATTWNNFVSASLANHLQAITNLYAKGARTLLMPNAVDITEVPNYYFCANKSLIRGSVASFNSGFATMLNQARALCPGLIIYVPNFFALLDNMLASPGNYGLINPYPAAFAINDFTIFYNYYLWSPPYMNYIFWDDLDPSARAHEVMADIAKNLISPAKITNVAVLNGSNRLDVINMPIGLSGYVDGRTSLTLGSWTLNVTNFNSISATQAIYVRTSSPVRYYRLRFPYAWSYP